MAQQNSLYYQVVGLTDEYLGPAAERFVSRQIKNHLRKDPEMLKVSDLDSFISWSRVTMSVLTEDTSIVNAYIDGLTRLKRSVSRQAKANG